MIITIPWSGSFPAEQRLLVGGFSSRFRRLADEPVNSSLKNSFSSVRSTCRVDRRIHPEGCGFRATAEPVDRQSGPWAWWIVAPARSRWVAGLAGPVRVSAPLPTATAALGSASFLSAHLVFLMLFRLSQLYSPYCSGFTSSQSPGVFEELNTLRILSRNLAEYHG